MINAIVVSNHTEETLPKIINQHCPQINIVERLDTSRCVEETIRDQEVRIAFFDLNDPLDPLEGNCLSATPASRAETIIITGSRRLAMQLMKFDAGGYVFKPVHGADLILAVDQALKSYRLKRECIKHKKLVENISKDNPSDQLIGVPTMEGFDFLHLEDIIRCEALQKCTKIVTRSGPNLVSSYNLGEFRKLLQPFSFFSPHRSHLINLTQVDKYLREGTIIMSDHSWVPVAQNKKKAFLDAMIHL